MECMCAQTRPVYALIRKRFGGMVLESMLTPMHKFPSIRGSQIPFYHRLTNSLLSEAHKFPSITGSQFPFYHRLTNSLLSQAHKFPSITGLEEDRTCNAASGRTMSPTHYRLSYSGPLPSNEFKIRQSV